MPKFSRWLPAMIAIAFLAGCGGSGGSSSGSPIMVILPGTYTGTATVTVGAAGLEETETGSIAFKVGSDGKVSVAPGTEFTGTGSITGNRFVLNVGANAFNEPGFTCTGSFRFEGTYSPSRVTGSVTSTSISCNGVNLTVSGTFSATRREIETVSFEPIELLEIVEL